jgi:hypothetical protein
VALALSALTTGRVAGLVLVLVGWAVVAGVRAARDRLVGPALVVLPVALLSAVWLVRNDARVGAPVWTTETGLNLWEANNAGTMHFLPSRSIDLSMRYAFAHMTADEQLAHDSLSDPVAADRMLGTFGRRYILSHPVETVRAAVVKVAVPVGAYLSPAHSWLVQLGFFAVYAPVHLLAIVGLWHARRAASTGIALAALTGFLATTAIYWAHTSHATVVDVVWFAYASAVVSGRSRQDAGATI